MSSKAVILVAGVVLAAAALVFVMAGRMCSANRAGRVFCALTQTSQPSLKAPAASVSRYVDVRANTGAPPDRIPPDSVIAPNAVHIPATGSAIHPGESFQAKVDAAPAGTVFIVKAGTHRMQRVAPKDSQKFVGEPGAVMSGAEILRGFTSRGDVWYAAVERMPQPRNTASRCQSRHPRCDMHHDLYIDNVLQQHVVSQAELGPGRWFYDYSAGRIYIGENPAAKTVEVTRTPAAFTGSARNVGIRGLIIEKYANRAQNGAIAGNSTTGWTVENNVLQFNHGLGIRIGHRMQVRGNRILRNGQMGIGGIGDDVLVESNEIAYNNTVGYRAGWEAGGTKFVRTSRLTARGNFVHHNEGPGLWTDIDNIHTLYETNRVEDNWGQGIFHEISYDAVIRNNQVRRNGHGRGGRWLYGAGILVAHSPNVEVYGNVVENNYHGIAGIQQNRGSGVHGPYKLRNLRVSNNVVRMGRGNTGVARDDGDDAVWAGSNVFSGNSYYVNTSKRTWWAWAGRPRDWPQWQSYGQDLRGKVDP